MDNVVTRIQLLGENEGYLDVLDNVTVPINFGISDVRDVGKRTGAFSKTIVLPGTKNNNELLNSYFDVNISAGTFNINTVQPCIVLQNNIPIVENAYLQLVSVNKLQDTLNEDDFVEYEVVIKDTVGDFFTKLGNRTLEGKDEGGIPYLDFSQFDHIFTAAAVTESFDNTYVDGYKYLLPWIEDNDFEYSLSECKPAIYAKQYWDKIHSSTGFSYTWSTLSNPNVQFDKLVIPYNGDDKKLAEESAATIGVDIARGSANAPLGQNLHRSFGIFSNTPLVVGGTTFNNYMSFQGFSVNPLYIYTDLSRFDLNTLVDPLNQWDQPGGNNSGQGAYVCAYDFVGSPNSGVLFKFSGTVSAEVRNNSATAAARIMYGTFQNPGINNGNPFPLLDGTQARVAIVVNKVDTNGNLTQVNVADIPVIVFSNPNQIFPANQTTNLITDVPFDAQVFLPSSLIGTGDRFRIGVTIRPTGTPADPTSPNGAPIQDCLFFRRESGAGNTNVELRAIVKDLQVKIRPQASTLLYNFPVSLNAFVPKQIKQSDFIKSICLMYNLYVQPDPANSNNLIYTHRDDFYDSGAGKDWTEKLDRSKEQILNFIPEVSNKKLILTYKQSDDVYNKLYQGTTTEIYGQQEVIFENEYVRGEAIKELIFSPTPMQNTTFGAVCPLIPGISPKNNIRILIDNGPKPCLGYQIRNTATQGDFVTVFEYPLLSHFNQQTDPTFDINFGVCDFYFYNIATFTSNNLFNNFWRRTVGQIDQGKLLTAYFMLDEGDISTLKLNDNIRIDNSWWNINKIVDYNANAKVPTKVELISADTGLKLPRVAKAAFPVTFGRPVDEFITPTEGMVGPDPIITLTPSDQITEINREESLKRLSYLNGWNQSGVGIVIGKNNILPDRFQGIVIGNNTNASAIPGLYVGDYSLTSNGLLVRTNKVGISGIIDGGTDVVLPYDKTNEADLIDGGEDSVRKFGGGTAGGFIIDGRDTFAVIVN